MAQKPQVELAPSRARLGVLRQPHAPRRGEQPRAQLDDLIRERPERHAVVAHARKRLELRHRRRHVRSRDPGVRPLPAARAAAAAAATASQAAAGRRRALELKARPLAAGAEPAAARRRRPALEKRRAATPAGSAAAAAHGLAALEGGAHRRLGLVALVGRLLEGGAHLGVVPLLATEAVQVAVQVAPRGGVGPVALEQRLTHADCHDRGGLQAEAGCALPREGLEVRERGHQRLRCDRRVRPLAALRLLLRGAGFERRLHRRLKHLLALVELELRLPHLLQVGRSVIDAVEESGETRPR